MSTTINIGKCAANPSQNRVVPALTCVAAGTDGVDGTSKDRLTFAPAIYSLKVIPTFSATTATARLVFDAPSQAVAETWFKDAPNADTDIEFYRLIAPSASELSPEYEFSFPNGLTYLDLKAVGTGNVSFYVEAN